MSAGLNNKRKPGEHSFIPFPSNENQRLEQPAKYCVVVIGTTGTGKSSLIKLFCGDSVVIGHSVKSTTKGCKIFEESPNPNINHVWMDTQGADDSDMKETDEEILKNILKKLYSENIDHIKIIWMVKGDMCREDGIFQKQAKFIASFLNNSDEKSRVWKSCLIILKNGPLKPDLIDIKGVAAAAVDNGAIQNSLKIFGYTCLDWIDQNQDRKLVLFRRKNCSETELVEEGYLDEIRIKEKAFKYLQEMPPLEVNFRSDQCSICKIEGDRRWIFERCHHSIIRKHSKQLEHYHESQIIQYHPLETIAFHPDPIVKYHDRIKTKTHPLCLELYHDQSSSRHHNRSIIYDHPLQTHKYHNGTLETIIQSNDKFHPGFSSWEHTGRWESPALSGKHSKLDIGPHEMEAFWRRILEAIPRWECCNKFYKNDSGCTLIYSCCGRSNEGCQAKFEHKWKYSCCAGDQNTVGCKEKYLCCGWEPTSLRTGCRTYYSCCGRNDDGCIITYNCCRKALDSMGCKKRYRCCMGSESSLGCQEYYECCLRNINDSGCKEKFNCCGNPKENTGCKTKYICCDQFDVGCKKKYQCCNMPVDSRGCKDRYTCCLTNTSDGCKDFCRICDREWGKSPGCTWQTDIDN